jgi:hypothetical protein
VRARCCVVLICLCEEHSDEKLGMDLILAEEQAYVLRKSSIMNNLQIPLWSDPDTQITSQSLNMYVYLLRIGMFLMAFATQSTTVIPCSNHSISNLARSSARIWKARDADHQTSRHYTTHCYRLLCLCGCQCLHCAPETGSC